MFYRQKNVNLNAKNPTLPIGKDQTGFTIIELMIATAVFSVVLLLCATAIVQIGQQFYKGTIVNRTQNSARTVSDDVVQAIQFGVQSGITTGGPVNYGVPAPGYPVQSLCLGTVRYSYTLARAVGNDPNTQSVHGLWKDRIPNASACTPLDISQPLPPGSSAGAQELLGNNMRVVQLNVTNPSGKIYSLDLVIAYGGDDSVFGKDALNNPDYTKCLSVNRGGQFCATSSISTQVEKRL